jgi:ankyrin repeat protein
MVKILVDKGANLTIKTSNGKTPAQLASVKANRAVIQIIEQG